ncbi:MAG: DinB family protein [Vicinamibacterales bacterium]
MPDTTDGSLLDAVLDSWDRNNTILVNLFRALSADALDVRTSDGGHTIGEIFGHLHHVRLVFVEEDAPEYAVPRPDEEWRTERDPDRFAAMLDESARAVRLAVAGRLRAGREMDRHYDHPVLLLQHMIWHEGYHHGQIKLALKLAGRPMANKVAGPLTWRVWMAKTRP